MSYNKVLVAKGFILCQHLFYATLKKTKKYILKCKIPVNCGERKIGYLYSGRYRIHLAGIK